MIKGGELKCLEEMEQARRARELEQAEEWEEEAPAVAGEEVSRLDREEIAFAQAAVKGHPINWVAPVMSSNVLGAEQQ